MEERDIKKNIVFVFVIFLLVVAFFIIKPMFIPLFTGLILAYLFNPIFKKINSKIKSKNISAFLVILCVVIVIIVPLIIMIPIAMRQVIEIYPTISNMDLSAPIQKLIPSLFEDPQLAANVRAVTSAIPLKITSFISSGIYSIFFNSINIAFNFVIIFFIFFFALRDHQELMEYFGSISPFSTEYRNKLYQKFDDVTHSVIYGELVVGVAQGVIAGIGYFILGIPNALMLTILTTLFSILPVIGPWLVWIPVDVYLFTTDRTGAAIGLLIYGLFIINWIDTIIRPIIVSKKTKMNESLALLGMFGGLYVFGIMGLIIGPLVLAYLLLIIETYREKKINSIILEETGGENSK